MTMLWLGIIVLLPYKKVRTWPLLIFTLLGVAQCHILYIQTLSSATGFPHLTRINMYHMDGTVLNYVIFHKYLNVTFNDLVRTSIHVNEIMKNCFSWLSCLWFYSTFNSFFLHLWLSLIINSHMVAGQCKCCSINMLLVSSSFGSTA